MGFVNKLDKSYTDLLQDILDNGTPKSDRTGTGTISVFGRQIRHKMSEGFPLLTTKKMPWKTIVTELLWFLRGDTNIKYLVDNNCHIWDGDAYKNYLIEDSKILPNMSKEKMTELGYRLSQEEFINKIKTDDEFAKKWGELGPIYGAQWRNWKTITKKWWDDPEYQGYGADTRSGWEYEETQIDQISELIRLLKETPDSRRMVVSAWAVHDLPNMVLPPCHYGFQVYTRELSIDERNDLLYKKIGGEHKRENCFSDEEFERETLQDCKAFNIPNRAISLMWNQRSCDFFLGIPFNIASYGLLLEIIAKEVNMVPDELIGNLGDVHLYSNHIEQAKEQIGRYFTIEERTEVLKQAMGEEAFQIAFDEQAPFGGGLSTYFAKYRIRPNLHTREPFPLPTLKFNPCPITGISMEYQSISQFEIENYQSHPTIKAPLSN